MPDLSEHTPVMRQYLAIKAQHPHEFVFYRMGDFYELFYEDAVEIARLLHLTLTRRGVSAGQPIPMAGVPAASLDGTLRRLLALGRSAVVCEQVDGASEGGGLIERRVSRIVTPGTLTDEGLLDETKENWIVAIPPGDERGVLAALESASGQFVVLPYEGLNDLRSELARLRPSEVLLAEDDVRRHEALADLLPRATTRLPPWRFDPERGGRVLRAHFGVEDLGGFGCADLPAAVAGAGLLIEYFRETQGCRPSHVQSLRTETPGDFLVIDPTSREQLAIEGREPPHLLHVLDTTRTAMGARLLRTWITRPSRNPTVAEARHSALDFFLARRAILEQVRTHLGGCPDLERITTRLELRRLRPRDLEALVRALERIATLAAILGESAVHDPLLTRLRDDLTALPELSATLRRALAEPLPIHLHDGGVIAEGYDPELDALRALDRDSGRALLEFEARERARTGLSTLRIRHQRLLGYSIEIPRSQSGAVPSDYLRRQTLKDVERYTSPELESFAARLAAARARALEREEELFMTLVEAAAAHSATLARAARALATLDVLTTLAERAESLRWSRPRFVSVPRLVLQAGRHPVLESTLPDPFVPNDLVLDAEHRLIILTGPNMGGKSTFMRQAALAVVLAYAGSYVPATAAEIGPFDRIFTRIGAGDELTRGRSTFMVEMLETAHILRHATDRSLVLLDEIGRGTGTYDGLALAYAVAEDLLERIRALTLFATHYFEITDLPETHPAAANLHVEARLENGRLVLLHEVRPGAATRSHGLDVAALAGVPDEVLHNARRHLRRLESNAPRSSPTVSPPPPERPARDPLRELLRELDPLRLNPLEAHGWIVRLRELLAQEEHSSSGAASEERLE